MFRDRIDAARQLAAKLNGCEFEKPVVLGIPRGGMVLAKVLADSLGADLNVLLTRKLRAPGDEEYAIGAIGEDGEAYLHQTSGIDSYYLEQEKKFQENEIKRRRKLFDSAKTSLPLANRSVIVTDDGIATGSTLIAGLYSLRNQGPKEIIAAIPVSPPDALSRVRRLCEQVVCLAAPFPFWAVGQFYQVFDQVSDAEVLSILKSHTPPTFTALKQDKKSDRVSHL